jgi:peptide subunit release factor 1 (eRF1)
MSNNGNGKVLCVECGQQPKDKISYKELRTAHDRLKKIHDAANEAIMNLHRKLDAAAVAGKIVAGQRDAANRNLEIQKQIVRDALDQHQAERKNLEAEIVKLRKELRVGNNG